MVNERQQGEEAREREGSEPWAWRVSFNSAQARRARPQVSGKAG